MALSDFRRLPLKKESKSFKMPQQEGSQGFAQPFQSIRSALSRFIWPIKELK